MTLLYISGPMTGIAEHNFPAFNDAAERLMDAGFDVSNPAANGEGRMSWADYLRHDLKDVLKADGIALLPDWTTSKGARLEVHVARALEVPIGYVDRWVDGGTGHLFPLTPQLDQFAVHEWSVRNFGEIPQTLVTLGLAEEVGELCRAVLKRAQGIRGTREEWNEEIRKELGDCVIKLLDIAAYEGVDLVQVTAARWDSVSKRNWVADPTGHGLPAVAS